ncbi:MAG: DNA repair protein RecO [Flavobacteriaceae bacterium]|nr:DNA repair protein RecO [Flavobacteriaceae bacterium]|tara:strand:- start:18338 stop:19060 length:723 start_codon:yes stop_codon:yes gene_type:complete
MLVKTSAIVIWTSKYGDSSVIANCYTECCGLKGYFLKNIFNSKNVSHSAAYFQPLTLLNLVTNHLKDDKLNYIKEVKINTSFNSIHNSIHKTSIALFISEILKSVLKEDRQQNLSLYNFLKTSIILLDKNGNSANFHIKFLIELTKHIGFYPNTSNMNKNYFDLRSGCFTNDYKKKYILSGIDLKGFKTILGMTFDDLKMLNWNQSLRKNLLRSILTYYSLHLQSFKTPKSIDVLNDLFK